MARDVLSEIRGDHERWHKEQEMWIGEVADWRRQYAAAKGTLLEIARLLTAEASKLDEHEAAILARAEKYMQRDGIVAAAQERGQVVDEDAIDNAHRTVQREHVRQRQSHKSVSAHHRKVLGTIVGLDRFADSFSSR